MSTALHAVGTIATGAAIALVGQIFNIEEHWPAAILLWAIAALAGWAAAPRRGPANPHFAASSRMDLLRTGVLHRAAHRPGSVPGPVSLRVGDLLSHHDPRLAAQGRARNSVRSGGNCGAFGFGLMTEGWASYGRTVFILLWHALLGLDRDRRRAAGGRRVQGTLGPDPAGCGHRYRLPCRGASTSGWSTTTSGRMHTRLQDRTQPRRPRAGSGLRRVHHLVGNAPGEPRAGQSRRRLFRPRGRLVLLQQHLRQGRPLARTHRAGHSLPRRRMGSRSHAPRACWPAWKSLKRPSRRHNETRLRSGFPAAPSSCSRHPVGPGLLHRGQVSLSALDLSARLDSHRGLSIRSC